MKITGERTAQQMILGLLVVHVGKNQNCIPASPPIQKSFQVDLKTNGKEKSLSLSEENIGENI